MSATDTTALRERSRDAFGQDYQLEVMLLIADATDVVNQKTIADELELTPSNVQTPWRRLVNLGLLVFRGRDHRSKYYERNDETLAWQFARELAGDLWRPGTASDANSSW